MADSRKWNVRMTFVCTSNEQSRDVHDQLTELGDKPRTDLLVATRPEDVRVLEIVTKTTRASDEGTAQGKAEGRYKSIIEQVEDFECEVTEFEEPKPEIDEDAEASLVDDRIEPDIEADPLSPDLIGQDADPLSPDGEAAADLISAGDDPLSPDSDIEPDPLDPDREPTDDAPITAALAAPERAQLADLIASAVNCDEPGAKQWYLWQIAKATRTADGVRDTLLAEGMTPQTMDDADVMGVAPGSGLDAASAGTDGSGGATSLDHDVECETVGKLIEALSTLDPALHVINLGDEEGNAVRSGVYLGSGLHYREDIERKRSDGTTYTATTVEEVADEDTEEGDGSLPCVTVC
jgi:hypothetical protein